MNEFSHWLIDALEKSQFSRNPFGHGSSCHRYGPCAIHKSGAFPNQLNIVDSRANVKSDPFAKELKSQFSFSQFDDYWAAVVTKLQQPRSGQKPRRQMILIVVVLQENLVFFCGRNWHLDNYQQSAEHEFQNRQQSKENRIDQCVASWHCLEQLPSFDFLPGMRAERGAPNWAQLACQSRPIS